jgi:DtxR family Mn-dependent transcriptional regulator
MLRTKKQKVLFEDTLKYVHECEYEGAFTNATTEGVAGAVGVSRDDAVRLVEAMQERLWIQQVGSGLRLTEDGRSYARRIIRTHRLIETFLASESSIASKEWHHQADRIEHRIDDIEVDQLAKLLGHPRFDPHGDPIPTAKGELPTLGRRPLSNFQAGDLVDILHVGDEPELIGRTLAAYRLSPGQTLKILSKNEKGLRFQLEGRELGLNPGEAELVQGRISKTKDSPNTLTLRQLKQGQSATLVGLSPACRGTQRNRLLDLGFVPGSKIVVENQSPLGSPTAYRIRGTLIALRPSQADWVLLDGESIL